jgi:hypothetical protein
VHQVLANANVMKAEAVDDAPQNVVAAKIGVVGVDAESKAAEHLRLNLKPHSKAMGQSEEIAAKERYEMFILYLFLEILKNKNAVLCFIFPVN